ncbi:hypothetical protein GQ42DRAFT_153975 [Ramicandelaber brevisporus]|nr:hypothetical protein GQ42DRAFT_153975 [Ramicandelaber brevisporus]
MINEKKCGNEADNTSSGNNNNNKSTSGGESSDDVVPLSFRFLDLPGDLVGYILAFLSVASSARLMPVNRALHDYLAARVWRTLPDYLADAESGRKDVLDKYGKHVRVINLLYSYSNSEFKASESWVDQCPNVTHYIFNPSKETLDTHLTVIKGLKNLRKLEFELPQTDSAAILTSIQKAIGSHPSIEHVSLVGKTTRQVDWASCVSFFNGLSGNIKRTAFDISLSLESISQAPLPAAIAPYMTSINFFGGLGGSCNSSVLESTFTPSASPTLVFPKLEELATSICDCTKTGDVLSKLTQKKFPALRRLHITDCSPTCSQAQDARTEYGCGLLRTLFSSPWPNLTEIIVGSQIALRTFSQIVDNSPNIETLELEVVVPSYLASTRGDGSGPSVIYFDEMAAKLPRLANATLILNDIRVDVDNPDSLWTARRELAFPALAKLYLDQPSHISGGAMALLLRSHALTDLTICGYNYANHKDISAAVKGITSSVHRLGLVCDFCDAPKSFVDGIIEDNFTRCIKSVLPRKYSK